ncbi:beta-galactosidase/beta-glucuronidase [Filimonas zeae]|uniref:DUF4279 domain-containing protein n=1 Tax=Filimonas zeae TaxID=1737353 RepID=A0A917IXP0_9BACT|nr:DUF4279 domain-containing protein [Filimonas zeae]MDR6338925.1 beta-galactosidase/beta-glucuronidase [Filimonas zeae]GGH65929.1 hypothetical protein GCM10011379_19590 [Filimonas zeae]
MVEIKLIFSVVGASLNPLSLSEVIKIAATRYWFKDDVIPNRAKLIRRKETCWEYAFDVLNTLDVNEVTGMFLLKFDSVLEALALYINGNNLESKLSLVVKMYGETPAVQFDKEFLKKIAQINAELEIDLYMIDENDKSDV